MSLLTILGATLIGLSLGLTGAGGSIVTLPVLVYLAGLPPKTAVGMSLFVVGSAAFAGALQRIRAGEFHFKTATLFAITGMIGAALGARLTPLISGHTLMLIFSLLMLFIAGNVLLHGSKRDTLHSLRPSGSCLLPWSRTFPAMNSISREKMSINV